MSFSHAAALFRRVENPSLPMTTEAAIQDLAKGLVALARALDSLQRDVQQVKSRVS